MASSEAATGGPAGVGVRRMITKTAPVPAGVTPSPQRILPDACVAAATTGVPPDKISATFSAPASKGPTLSVRKSDAPLVDGSPSASRRASSRPAGPRSSIIKSRSVTTKVPGTPRGSSRTAATGGPRWSLSGEPSRKAHRLWVESRLHRGNTSAKLDRGWRLPCLGQRLRRHVP